jgi:hypothetical protein
VFPVPAWGFAGGGAEKTPACDYSIKTAIADAITWRRALETDSDSNYQRAGKRVIIYPAFLKKFATVAVAGNVGLDLEGGHDIAYLKIMEECPS